MERGRGDGGGGELRRLRGTSLDDTGGTSDWVGWKVRRSRMQWVGPIVEAEL